jgi:RHS repeat-associated protein
VAPVLYGSLNNPNTRWWLMNRMKFTGLWRDDETGLDHTLYRQYPSTFGRWYSPDEFTGGPADAFSSNDPSPPGPLPYADILNPQSLNKYAYAYNNPMRYIDPAGRRPLEWLKYLFIGKEKDPPPPPPPPAQAPKQPLAILKTDINGRTTTFITGSTGSKEVSVVQIETRTDVSSIVAPGF